jgi:tetratricopeptide (TPR) repeat protein
MPKPPTAYLVNFWVLAHLPAWALQALKISVLDKSSLFTSPKNPENVPKKARNGSFIETSKPTPALPRSLIYQKQTNQCMKKVALVFALLLSLSVQAQNFDAGYRLLEAGKFAEGAAFFKTYLTTTPDSTNRTALLCYGRGVGLSSSAVAAQQVFQSLLKRYPNDLEIQLNWAESLMWNKQFADARAYYETLLAVHPKNFNALLGCANALSSLGQFEQSLALVEKANAVDPKNANLKITRKYGRLGWASQLAGRQGYQQAMALLDAIFEDFPNDIDTRFLKAQIFGFQEQYTPAKALFEGLIGTANQTDAYLQLAYIAFLEKKARLALAIVQKAYDTAPEADKNKLRVGRINALGWNKRFAEAFAEIDKLAQQNPNNPEIALLKARLSIWGKQYQKGASFYEVALKQSPDSFDANLGFADANHAQGMDKAAFAYANRTLQLFPKQADAERFLEKLRLSHAPSIDAQFFVSEDNGQNTSTNYVLRAGYDLHTQFRFVGGYRLRKAGTASEPNQAQVQILSGGFHAKPLPFLAIDGEVNQINTHSPTQQNSQLAYQIGTEWRLGRWQQLTLKYNLEPQTFTAGLIEYNLFYKNYILNYNLTTPIKVGFYTQAIKSEFSDRNQRQLLFASLYYDLIYQPVIKFGVNYQYITFKQRVPRCYFSPFAYHSVEVFLQAENLNMPKQKVLYQVSLAAGTQKVEDQDAQPTYRLGLSLGFRPEKRVDIQAYYNRSNIATTTAVGYTYNETGIKAKFLLTQAKQAAK